MDNEAMYAPAPLKMEFVHSLMELMNWCSLMSVEIESTMAYMHGFRVTFKGVPGDAICNEGSYGHPEYWETYHMPWDYDDVSTHTPEELAKKLAALLKGEDWEAV